MRTALALSALLLAASSSSEANSYSFTGTFFEGCSCKDACRFEIDGSVTGCAAAGFYSFDIGNFGKESLAGTKLAFAVGPEGWLKLYVDAPTKQKLRAVSEFARAAMKDFGKIESIQTATIQISGHRGSYVGTVAGGNVLRLETSRVPRRSEYVYNNLFDPRLHPQLRGAKTESCIFSDGNRSFGFVDSSAYFNSKNSASGRLK